MGKPFPTSGEETVKAQKPGVLARSGNGKLTQRRTSEFVGSCGGPWKGSFPMEGVRAQKCISPGVHGGKRWRGRSMGQRGNERTWSTLFPFDPEQLCKERREGCRLGFKGTYSGHPALSREALPFRLRNRGLGQMGDLDSRSQTPGYFPGLSFWKQPDVLWQLVVCPREL